ncbi:MAG TPA: YraN family protein [Fimbriimonadaceae bacterium]|nr:YraN family protein [Fimbriimonadaceae bacterium]
MPDVRRLGLEAEDAAAEFLAAQGYTLVTRRFRAGAGEIDLVAFDGDVLAFVEVKLRRGQGADPLDALDLPKQTKILSAAEIYLARYDGPECEVRFDVVSVTPKGMTLHKDAFRPR